MSNALRVCAVLTAFTVVPALAQDYTASSLRINHPWARATPKGMGGVGGGYLMIKNTGSVPDRLVGGSSPVSKKFEIHEMSITNGVMQMRKLPNGLEIGPGKTVKLKPDGLHVMFVCLNRPLKQGDKIPATLEFAKAGELQVNFTVERMGAIQGNRGLYPKRECF